MTSERTNRPNESTSLPAGLAEAVEAFVAAADARNKRVSDEARQEIIERFTEPFGRTRRDWKRGSSLILTVAGMAGRLAAVYAELDGKVEVDWTHARFGLRDAQAECQADVQIRGKYCQNVVLDA